MPLIMSGFLLISQFFVIATASGATRMTTYDIGEEGPPFTWGYPPICKIDVSFSWDKDTWKTGDTRQIGFDFEIKDIDPNVVELDLSITRIEIQMTGKPFDNTVELAREDWVGTQLSQLVMRRNSTTIASTPLSYSYEVRVPTADNPPAEDTNVQLYYVVSLSGNCIFQKPDGTYLPGNGQIIETVSNEGSVEGGEPVVVTYESAAQSAWSSIAFVAAGLLLVGMGVILFVRGRKSKKAVAQPDAKSRSLVSACDLVKNS